jgi:hypothetical protein
MISLTCVLIVSRAAVGQTCLGAAQFSAGSVRIAGSASFGSGTSEYDGQVAIGANDGIFVSASGGAIVPKGGGTNGTVLGADIGYSLVVGSAMQVCPLVSYTHTTFTGETDDGLGFGGSLGTTARISPQAVIVPFVGATYVHATAKFSGISVSGNYGVAELGVGLVLNKSITLRPSVATPFGLGPSGGGTTVVGITLGFNFGH